jgi:hypothetical protein
LHTDHINYAATKILLSSSPPYKSFPVINKSLSCYLPVIFMEHRLF